MDSGKKSRPVRRHVLPRESAAPCSRRTLLANALLPWVGVVALAALPHDPYLRYLRMKEDARKTAWVYERTHFSDRPIDVALLGSSRTMTAVDDQDLERRLADRIGGALAVANCAVAWEGRNLQLVLARGLFARPAPRLLIVEVLETEPHRGHVNFADLADGRDILQAPLVINLDYPRDVGELPRRNAGLWATQLSGGVPAPGPVPDHFAAAKDVARSVAYMDSALARLQAGRRERYLPRALDALEFRAPRRYLRQIHELAARHGCRVVHLYVPHYRAAAPPHDLVRYQAAGPVWIPPRAMTDDAANWADATHMNARGNGLLTAWLATMIRDAPDLLAPGR